MPTLYVVATPIGNLEDVTLRALRILKEVSLIAAEDTRKTRKLLSYYGINTPLTSYYEGNERAKLTYLLNQLKEKNIALVSEAGMPGISDPGYELIKAAIEQGIPVVPIPGPSAILTALAISGLPTSQFIYLGFLPRKKGERRHLLQSLADEPRTLVIFESPHRLLATLKDMAETLGDREIVICRELTKFHEEVFRGKISQAIDHFPEPKGEFTLVIEGKTQRAKTELTPEVREELHRLQEQGIAAKEAIARLSKATGISRKELYRAWLAQLAVI